MSVTLIETEGRQPYYSVRKYIRGKCYSRCYPKTKDGYKKALAKDDEYQGYYNLAQSVDSVSLIADDGTVRGLSLAIRWRTNRVEAMFRIHRHHDGARCKKAFSITTTRPIDKAYDAAIDTLRKFLGVSQHGQREVAKELVHAYSLYFAEYETKSAKLKEENKDTIKNNHKVLSIESVA